MDTVRSTLGPRGMDKLVFDGQKVTISNDGATIMKLLDIAHPAAKTLVDISMSQDAEVKNIFEYTHIPLSLPSDTDGDPTLELRSVNVRV